MGLLNKFTEWREKRYKEHFSKMKEENKCPDCFGKGFIIYPANVYAFHADHFHCPGCKGSGLFNDWSPLE
ncbi:methionine aminopeptidase [Cytobacillus purgationiresistens]|uniref:DnaJ-class molecular chaperone n=1 Tax=Cytobacillus purgationiresistens TaxID=863449 RepID=A0ABU0AAY6_9BACI|nr:methionine aminopeptidase [Cytobacillus purgationiresistens]MDQ0268185.1 DnaJ-class molecular chaperone [Cytobacillus purgationiresistens]